MKNSNSPSRRTLVAGVGNVLRRDDGFGVEVVQRLRSIPMPEGVTVIEFGICGMHLALELLEGYERVVVVDALAHGDAPGTIRLFEADVDSLDDIGTPDGHNMQPVEILAFLRSIGVTPPPITVVGCAPESVEEGLGLSDVVAASVDHAVRAVLELIDAGGTARVPGNPGADYPALR
jgi:hydrogenase maturation protease